MEPFCNILKEQRNRLNLSRKELAELIGASTAAIGFYETGKSDPTASILLKIARALHISLDALVGYKVEPLPEYERYKRYLEGLGYSVTDGNVLAGITKGVTVYTENPYKAGEEKITDPNIPKGSERIYFSSRAIFLEVMGIATKKALNEHEGLLAKHVDETLHSFATRKKLSKQGLEIREILEGKSNLSTAQKTSIIERETVDSFKKDDIQTMGDLLRSITDSISRFQRIPLTDAAPPHGGPRDLHVEDDGGGDEDERKE